jgi:microcystin-dependent protein
MIKNYLVLFLFLTIATFQGQAQVGINNSSPDASAILDMKSDSLGFLIPRMTSQFRRDNVDSPANGLMVFDTTESMIYCYDALYSGGDENWVGISPWRFYTYGTFKYVNLDLTARNVIVGATSADSLNSFTVNGNMVIGDDTQTSAANSLTVKGDVVCGELTVTDTLKATAIEGKGAIPVGGIIIWTGTTAAIPDNWVLCDGSTVNGLTTPDLRGRFIASYNNSDSDYEVTDSGGENFHTLTTNEMPSHTHTTESAGEHAHGFSDKVRNDDKNADPGSGADASDSKQTNASTTADNSAHQHVIPSVGLGEAHENRPPYYVVAYIIRYQ